VSAERGGYSPPVPMLMGASEVVEALANRRRAGEPFSEAWPAVTARLTPGQRELFRTETFEAAYRDAYERRPPQPRHAFPFDGVLDDASERERHAVLG
jgi:hypothetical protein